MEPLYNLDQLKELAGGQDEFVQTMVDTFLEHTPRHLDELLTAYSAGDLVQMGAMAHKIKPSIDLFGITSLSQVIREVEQVGKGGQASDDLDAMINRVSEVLHQVFESMKNR